MSSERPSTPPSSFPLLPKTTPVGHNQSGSRPYTSGPRPGHKAERFAHVADMKKRVLTPHLPASVFIEKFFPKYESSRANLFRFPEGAGDDNGKEFVSASPRFRTLWHGTDRI